jgi:hypothetical protein
MPQLIEPNSIQVSAWFKQHSFFSFLFFFFFAGQHGEHAIPCLYLLTEVSSVAEAEGSKVRKIFASLIFKGTVSYVDYQKTNLMR